MAQQMESTSVIQLFTGYFSAKYHTGYAEPIGVSWQLIDVQKDIPMIYEWVQLPYAQPFWKMDHLSFDEFEQYYTQMLNAGNGTSLLGFFDGKPVCQVELYDCAHDEISRHYEVKDGDIGLHFLMAPPAASRIAGISLTMMQSVLSLVLNAGHIHRVMGEPDSLNEKANKLVRSAGFRFIRQIQMSYKVANLYACTRESFSKK